MRNMVTAVTQDTFEKEVLQSDKPVLVDFWASWCGPCKMMGPIIDKLANAHPEYKVCKVNVDEQQQLAARYGILSIPTVIAFKGGRQAAQSVGVVPEGKLLALLQ